MNNSYGLSRALTAGTLALAASAGWGQVGFSRTWISPAVPSPPSVTVVVPPVQAKAGEPAGLPDAKVLREKLDRAKSLTQDGILPLAAMSEMEQALSLADSAGERERSAALQRDVDIQLKNAPIRQVADALSRASGVKISVNEGVPKDQRVNLEARRVPLASVLEAVARQANLIISPDGEGVSLGPMPSLTVNGESRRYTVRRPPWSDDWLIPPTTRNAFGGGGVFFGGGSTGGFGGGFGGGSGGSAPMAWTFGNSGPAGLPGADRYSLAAVGDRVVVAEPGTNDAGDAGVWLTVYRLQGDELVQVSQKFQKGRGSGIVKRTLKIGGRSEGPDAGEAAPDANP